MFSSAWLFLVTLLAAVTVNAHFQLQFPPPRGVFNEPNEINICDGYPNVAANRTEFPLKGGFYSLNSEHPKWTAGVTLSTSQNPQSFDDFDLVNAFFQLQGEGAFCIPLDFSTTNFTLTSGQNVTIEVVFDGGDGMLYQCADLTLSDNFTIPSSVSCTNATGSASPTSTAPGSTSSSGSASSPSSTNSPGSSAALPNYPTVHTAIAALFVVVGLVLA